MTRDPFYRQIIERLNDKIDPDLFEECADIYGNQPDPDECSIIVTPTKGY